MLTAAFGWNHLEDCAGILHFDSDTDAEVSASKLRILGGSYRAIEVVKLTEKDEEFLIWLKLKQSM